MSRPKPKSGDEKFPGFGDRLRIAMRRAGHRKLASLAAELGVTESSLSRWCSGHDISLANAVALSRCLQVSLDWLVTGAEQAPAPDAPCTCGMDRPSREALAAVGVFLQGLTEAHPRTANPDSHAAIAQGATEFSQN